jgi:hypothetical protein
MFCGVWDGFLGLVRLGLVNGRCPLRGLLKNVSSRVFIESLSLIEISHRDLSYRSCPGGLAKKPFSEIYTAILKRGFLQKFCQQSSYKHFV